MADEILQEIAGDVKEIQVAIDRAKILISAMKEAGEDTHEMEADIRLLEVRKTKWERMLKSRGISF